MSIPKEIESIASERMREYQKAYREEHREELNAYSKEWRRQFKERTGMSYNKAVMLRKVVKELGGGDKNNEQSLL